MMGIVANIYRTKSFPGRGNFFESVDEVTVIGTSSDGGKTVAPLRGGVFEPTPKAPAVVLVFRMMGGQRLVHAIPYDGEAGRGKVGPMAGGTFINTSDSRFSEATGLYAAISLHDRFETREVYNAMSV